VLRHGGDPRGDALFAGLTPRLVDALSQKRLWNSLDHAGSIRNEHAHGGAENDAYRRSRMNELERDLADVREILGMPLQDVRLVRPGPSGRRGGIRHYREADLLRGPDEHFDPGAFVSALDLDEDRLYVMPSDGLGLPSAATQRVVEAALELPPLIRLGPPPATAQNACYFYNRRQGAAKLKFVSYHHDDEPDRFEAPDPELELWIDALNFPADPDEPEDPLSS
jgi:hypothetical protein